MKSILETHLYGILTRAICHKPTARALIVFDRESGLSRLLTDAYQAVLPEAAMIEFSPEAVEVIREKVNMLSPSDLVILVQSSSFRLNDFRFRLELFNRSLAVIEHPHLGRMPEGEFQTYVDSLAYDQIYYRTLGLKLKERIDQTHHIVVTSPGARLEYMTTFETAKLNIGDYTGMKNIGGQFPIGEVFTEPTNLDGVNGTVKLFAYGGMGFKLAVPEEPVLVVIEKGLIVDAPNAPTSFQEVLDQISQDEPLWVRELGFGMNRALTRNRLLTDIGSYERMCGIHLSLGQKHTVYAKPGFSKRKSKYHVDVFVDVESVTIDGETVYEHGTYCI